MWYSHEDDTTYSDKLLDLHWQAVAGKIADMTSLGWTDIHKMYTFWDYMPVSNTAVHSVEELVDFGTQNQTKAGYNPSLVPVTMLDGIPPAPNP